MMVIMQYVSVHGRWRGYLSRRRYCHISSHISLVLLGGYFEGHDIRFSVFLGVFLAVHAQIVI